MDPVTHTLSGIVFGKTFTRDKALFTILIVTSLLPDLDMILLIHSKESFLNYHRGITHGILALLILPLIFALIFKKKHSFFKVYAISFTGYALHIFLDLTNQYGTKILSPFYWTSYDLSLTFIVDPYVLLPFLFSLIFKITKAEPKRCPASLNIISIFLSITTHLS